MFRNIRETRNEFSRHVSADVAELVDAPDLGSGAARCESSSLSVRTIINKAHFIVGFVVSGISSFYCHSLSDTNRTHTNCPNYRIILAGKGLIMVLINLNARSLSSLQSTSLFLTQFLIPFSFRTLQDRSV